MAQGQWITKNGKRIFVGGDQAGAVREAARTSAIDAARGGAHAKNPATNPPKQAKTQGKATKAAAKPAPSSNTPPELQTLDHLNRALQGLGIKHPVEKLVESVASDKNLFPNLSVKVNANGDITATGSGKGTVTRQFTKGPDGKAVCVNAAISLPKGEQGKGKGTELFAEQVKGLKGSGVDRIEAMAIRGKDANGYYTWPRLGFDANLPREVKGILPDQFKDANRVSDLMKSPEGRDWWKQNGVGMSMQFDMKPGSYSQKVLDAYTKTKPDTSSKTPTPEKQKQVTDKVKADPKEHKESQKLAQAKIKDAPVPTREQVKKARDELEKAKRGEGRAGGDSRGGGSADRRRQRQNLFREWGGEQKGYIVCPWTGTKMHWSKDPKENPKGFETFERGKIFTKNQGGGYQLPNLIPESFEANRSRNDAILRKENTGKLRK